MNTATVLIPLYRSTLTPQEEASVRRTAQVLAAWPVVALLPQGIEPPALCRTLRLDVRAVSDEWLGTRNGIAGYNRMMLDEAFYALFADSEYLLVCHADAWIFRDELADWCRLGYDCVAAPWLRRPVYDLPLVKQYMAWRAAERQRKGLFSRQQLYGRIGNGGLSLRRTESFRAACVRYRDVAEEWLRHRHHSYNEDVFWATVPEEFRYPSPDEALHFAIDTNPAYGMRRLNGALPFGCHSWTKPRMYRFWQRFIDWK